MSIRYENIGELVTNDATLGDGSPLGLLTDAAIERSRKVCSAAYTGRM